MDGEYIKDLYHSVIRELIRYRIWVAVSYVLLCFLILSLGFLIPKSYETSALLYADESNIIQPLLKGRAEMTQIDRSQQAQESIYTRRLLLQIANKSGLLADADLEQENRVVKELRSSLKIESEGRNYFRISYSDSEPDRSFEVLNNTVNVFISDAAQKKKEESYNAFKFIESQVKTYKGQLEAAEENLKQFKASNFDGTEASASARITTLRTKIEEIKLAIEEQESKRRLVNAQLSKESKFQESVGTVDKYLERISLLKAQLDVLRLSYQESYPDIVSLKNKITELEDELAAVEAESGYTTGASAGSQNPLYEELRKQQAATELELSTLKRRLSYLQKLLEEAYKRAARIAENQAELSDLTRDYNVTRSVYEEMLERQESARLSMTLDIEGQGVSYKIQEPAVFPLVPAGLHFVHYAFLGPFTALLLLVGAIAAYVVMDPRIRSISQLAEFLPQEIEVLGIVPHVNTPLRKRLHSADIYTLGVVCSICIIGYVAIVVAKLTG